jgi:hypothetical protein
MRVVIPAHGDVLLDLEVGDGERGKPLHASGRAVIPVGEQELHVELPVEAEVTLDRSGNVTDVRGGPDSEAIAEARSYARSLISNEQIEGPAMRGGATHGIEVDADGRKVLRRKRFSAY